MPETRDPQVEDIVRRVVSRAPDAPAFPSDDECETLRRRGSRRRAGVVTGAIALVAAVVLIVGVVSASDPDQRSIVVAPSTTEPPSGPTRLEAVAVYERPATSAFVRDSLTPDPVSGVWFLTVDRGDLTLHHLEPGGKTRSIPLSAKPRYPDVGSPSVAVDPDGTAWAIGETALVQVSPGARRATAIPLGTWPGPGPYLPFTLASDGAGHVAIGGANSGVVRIYDASAHTFSDLRLPVGTDATALRYFGDGSLAIGLFTNADSISRAVIAAPDGTLSRRIPVGNSSIVNPYSSTAVLLGGIAPTMLNRDGTTRSVVVPAAISKFPYVGGVQRGRDGMLVVPYSTGVAIVSESSGTEVATFVFPKFKCGPTSVTGPMPGREAQEDVRCRETPSQATVDTDGNIWMLYDNRPGDPLMIKRIEVP